MGYVVKVPKLGLEMDAGTVVEWFLEEGDSVEAEEPIAEIESEKTTAEIDAREDGVLRRIVLAEGESAPPGAPMAVVAAADADIADLLAEAGASEGDDAEGAEASGTEAAETGGSVGEAEPEAGDDRGQATAGSGGGKISPRARKRADELDIDPATVSGSGPGGAVTEEDVERAAEGGTEAGTTDADAETGAGEEPEKVSPRARKRADELGVDLSTVTGTGPGGAVTAEDVEAAAERAGEEEPSDVAAGGQDEEGRTVVEERPLDGMRRTISSRLGESYRNAVHVTEHRTADAGSLRRAAKAATAVHGTDVSVTDVLVSALSAALEEHPAFNATFEEEVHRLYADRNVALAVDVDDGLITPVIGNVEERSIAELADERRRMTDRALSGEFTMDDLSGGTFTVSNLGLLGVESFDPIINPPQVAILGVNALSERAVARDGEVVVREVLPLDLSFDHRVVDGADAARFLATLVERLENPWPLLDGVSPSDAPAAVAANEGNDDPAADAVNEGDGVRALPERNATASLDPDLSGTVTAGGYEWPFDVTPEFGGGRHPTPIDYFTGALSACLSASIGVQADMREIAFEGIEVSAESEPAEGSVESIDLEVALSGVDDADDDALDRIVTGGERTCHVAELLREDLEVTVSWRRAD
ncbi:2-oxo acid dehydrogenase subunit E2 [Halopenitus salinus]|uniref:2-oxo acid dehydrogenase subunit E2 n=1 Tax=Halopenitus salinus TaxID=1198295 RepID=A0ABD5USF3_9EURY